MKRAQDENTELQSATVKLNTDSQTETARLQDLIDNPPKVFRFNVWWDKDGVPYCPLDKNMPLGNWVRTQFHGMFHCSMHNNYVPLMDDDGQHLTFVEAKQRLQIIASETQADTQTPKQLS
jgi:hypothetical protein